MTENTYDGERTEPLPPPAEQPAAPRGVNTDNLRDYRRMQRSAGDRTIAGVAGGLARHLDIDPTVLRVLFVVLVFFGGAGLVLYAALWLFVPDERTGRAVLGTAEGMRNGLLVAVLVVAALLAIGDASDGSGVAWPLAIAAIVVAGVLISRDQRRAAVPPAPPGHPGQRGQPGRPGQPVWEADKAASPAPPHVPFQPPPSPRPVRSGPLLFGTTLALLALALGALGLYDAAGGSVEDAAYPALALAVIGAVLVVGAFHGRAGGLIALGVLAVAALAGAAIGEPGFDGDRDRLVRPASAAELATSYDVPAGRIVLDLTAVSDPENLDGLALDVDVNAGAIELVVPRELAVRYDAHVEYGGEVVTPDTRRDGWGTHLVGRLGDADPVAELEVDMELGFGHVEVSQR